MPKANETPLSKEAIEKYWPDFIAAIRHRLDVGRLDYGDHSFVAPVAETLDELEQEFLDVPGWSFIHYVRIRRLRERLKALVARLPDGEQL